MWYVFFGERRTGMETADAGGHLESGHGHGHAHAPSVLHESPPVMTFPLALLAVCAIGLSIFGTPVWPWFHSYLSGHATHASGSIELGTLLVMALSAVIALGGIAVGWIYYSRRGPRTAAEPDPLETKFPETFRVLRWNAACAAAARWVDEFLLENVVRGVSLLVVVISWISRTLDELVVNGGFDEGCRGLRRGAGWLALWQNGQVQRYLRVIGLALTIGALLFIWGCK
jgi:NADH:ubiquinone oxidoreductase subunit 5 (subunit L)/multisubunit Na+/H+ antiporter MnhA subunit